MESAFEKQNIIKIMCQPKMIFNFFYGFFATKKKKDHMMILFKKTVADKSF